jgi:hypothetical protein
MKRMAIQTTAALLATGLLGITSSAMAAYSHTAGAGGVTLGSSQTPLPGTVSYPYFNVSGQQQSQATVSFSSNPIPAVSMTSSASNPVGEIQFSASGVMTYTFEVMAQPFTQVPINFAGVFSAFQNGQGSLSASRVSFDIFSTNASSNTLSTFSLNLPSACGGPTNCASFIANGSNTSYTFAQPNQFNVNGTFQGTIQFLTNANGQVAGSVQLVAGSTVRAFPGVASSAAFIDPHLEIAPAFLAANPGATLSITAGVGNEISPVPELSSLSLMIAGISALVLVVRRRRTFC